MDLRELIGEILAGREGMVGAVVALGLAEQVIPTDNRPAILSNERANLRKAIKGNPGERCGFCQYFEKPTVCTIIVGPVSKDLVCDWIQSREVSPAAPLYKVKKNDWIAFGLGMVKEQPYQHIVRDVANTPEGQLVMIEDTSKPPHRFSLTREFHIGHTSLEHHWTQKEVDDLVAVGKKIIAAEEA